MTLLRQTITMEFPRVELLPADAVACPLCHATHLSERYSLGHRFADVTAMGDTRTVIVVTECPMHPFDVEQANKQK